MRPDLRETNKSLWGLAAAPAIWAAHLLLSYATAAIWCAKATGPDVSLSGVRLAIGGYTVVALGGITAVGWRAWKRNQLPAAPPPYDDDSPADRHRFLAFATLLLSGLSAVAVVYTALAVVFVQDCR